MEPGELLTRWTIRIALVLYGVAVSIRLTAKPDRCRLSRARWLWTAGLVAYLAHVACAFHFYHDWSHDAAYAATAAETEEVFGLRWGGGLYVNYFFSCLWGLDVGWSWIRPDGYRARSRWVQSAVYGFMAFMAFQAVVVFEAGVVRWVGLGCTTMFVVFWFLRRRTRT